MRGQTRMRRGCGGQGGTFDLLKATIAIAWSPARFPRVSLSLSLSLDSMSTCDATKEDGGYLINGLAGGEMAKQTIKMKHCLLRETRETLFSQVQLASPRIAPPRQEGKKKIRDLAKTLKRSDIFLFLLPLRTSVTSHLARPYARFIASHSIPCIVHAESACAMQHATCKLRAYSQRSSHERFLFLKILTSRRVRHAETLFLPRHSGAGKAQARQIGARRNGRPRMRNLVGRIIRAACRMHAGRDGMACHVWK